MRRLALMLLIFAGVAIAQPPPGTITWLPGAPPGGLGAVCTTPNVGYLNTATGVPAVCPSGTHVWTALAASGGSTPSGPAGGDLSGSYPNPSLANPVLQASIVVYTPAASVLLTCPSATADTVTVFAPGNAAPASYTALAASMAITWAACTPGQYIILAVKQASSGGPFSVTGRPSGAPDIASTASVITAYTFHAVTSSTVAFDNVSADSGPGQITESAAPGTPPAGFGYIWDDSTNHVWQFKNPSGTVSNTSVPQTCSANQAFTAMSAAGAYTCTALGTATNVAFSGITSGTNTVAAMVVGAGASLDFTSTGTINASTLGGSSKGTSGATIPLLSTANTWTTAQTFGGALLAADGSAGNPAYSFSGATNLGLHRISGNILAFDSAGAIQAALDTVGLYFSTGKTIGWASGVAGSTSGVTAISSPSSGIMAVGTGAANSTAGHTRGASFQSAGTKFTASGCSNSTTLGGATSGSFASGTTGTCTVTITMGSTATAPTGWSCHANDQTTPANLISQTTGGSTTTAVITGTTVSGDVVSFGCIGY